MHVARGCPGRKIESAGGHFHLGDPHCIAHARVSASGSKIMDHETPLKDNCISRRVRRGLKMPPLSLPLPPSPFPRKTQRK